ncbi:hypothetical protein [Paludibaculum fermentans]|uniref:Cytochrome c domain-containing protein n=1 Tax=Paludibaculum fermentans TaxID=1473598 RepID=A0A7S7NWD0_PALFE|nr:hypothetical protein [Paludibaculum fermentans]QOY91008.1 hypothetical protein IRI77_14005 [Paludibaculum fermentans]
MKAIRLILPAATLVAAFLATSGISFATKEMAGKEKKPCVTCHEKGKAPTKEAPLLNEVGKFYKEKKTLEGAPKK